MRHARPDYDRIQDPTGKIPDAEPVFLIRGQDKAGPATLRTWAELHLAFGGDTTLAFSALYQANRMVDWQKNMRSKVADQPDSQPADTSDEKYDPCEKDRAIVEDDFDPSTPDCFYPSKKIRILEPFPPEVIAMLDMINMLINMLIKQKQG